jgi:prepilin-type processing-associated H-X9-DG protein
MKETICMSAQRSRKSGEGPRTSGMAIASLILALLGCTAPLGLILGIVALVQINRNPRRLSGSGLAIGAIVIGALASLVAVLLLPAMLLPAFSGARHKASAVSCLSNTKQLGLGVTMYCMDYGEYLPASHTWSGALTPYVMNQDIFDCPSRKKSASCDYTYNASLNMGYLGNITSPAQMPLLWDGNGDWNASGGFSTVEFRHSGSANFAFVDGHSKPVSEEEATRRWGGGQ